MTRQKLTINSEAAYIKKATEVAFIDRLFALVIQTPLNWIDYDRRWLADEGLLQPALP